MIDALVTTAAYLTSIGTNPAASQTFARKRADDMRKLFMRRFTEFKSEISVAKPLPHITRYGNALDS